MSCSILKDSCPDAYRYRLWHQGTPGRVACEILVSHQYSTEVVQLWFTSPNWYIILFFTPVPKGNVWWRRTRGSPATPVGFKVEACFGLKGLTVNRGDLPLMMIGCIVYLESLLLLGCWLLWLSSQDTSRTISYWCKIHLGLGGGS